MFTVTDVEGYINRTENQAQTKQGIRAVVGQFCDACVNSMRAEIKSEVNSLLKSWPWISPVKNSEIQILKKSGQNIFEEIL